MTLVQVLTQSLPVQKAQGDPTVPEKLPALFFEIARHCLARNPQSRYTVAQTRARLQPATTERKGERGHAPSENRHYWLAAAMAGILLIAVLAGQRLLRPSSALPPAQAPQVSKNQQASSSKTTRVRAPQAVTPAKPQSELSNQGAVAERVLPRVPQSARDTIQGKVKVRVRVKVDPSGNVTEVTFDSAGPSQYFARLARQAAQDWKFTPPQVEGANVASQWALRFEFGRNSTEVFPSEVAPQTHH